MSTPASNSPGLLKSWARKHAVEFGLLLAIATVAGATILLDGSRAYLEKPWQNATEILRQTSVLGIFALGAAIVIISGGIDLSSGSVIAFSSTICASLIFFLAPVDQFGVPNTSGLGMATLAIAIAGTLVSALLIGSLHAWLITAMGLPPFVATLASLVGLRSLARALVQNVTAALSSRGRNTQIYIDDETFRLIGHDWRIPLGIFLVLSLAAWVLMSRTVLGRHLYAMGGNEEAARLSGIRTERLKWFAYCVGAMTASIAGILNCSYVGMANPATQGAGEELNAIAAAVVGGCGLAGGIGTIFGTMLGALFLRVVIDSVAKTVKTNPDEFQGLVVGLLVVLAVAFNELRRSGGPRKEFFPGALGIVSAGVLSLLAGVVAAVMAESNKTWQGCIVGGTMLVVLAAKKIHEIRAARLFVTQNK